MPCGFPYCGGNDCANCHKPAPPLGDMRAEFMAWVESQGCDTDGAWSAWQGCWNRLASGCTQHPADVPQRVTEAEMEEAGRKVQARQVDADGRGTGEVGRG
jgi:hypothetical protein